MTKTEMINNIVKDLEKCKGLSLSYQAGFILDRLVIRGMLPPSEANCVPNNYPELLELHKWDEEDSQDQWIEI
jgi:hypothetical protein